MSSAIPHNFCRVAKSLDSFLRYLNQNNYTAVVAHMLDMFTTNGATTREKLAERGLKSTYRHHDLSDLMELEYDEAWDFCGNKTSNPDIRVLTGGIRKSSFGFEGWLSKHCLIYGPKISPINYLQHGVIGASVADVSCVLYHFEFTPDFKKRAREAVAEGSYYKNSMEYRQYLSVLEQRDSVENLLSWKNPKTLHDTGELIDEGFLQTAEVYDMWTKHDAQQ